jgi:excisionase family DNA binding protein
MEKLYTYKEVATILKVSERTIKRLLDNKNLPVILVGRSVRIEESVVEKLLVRVEPISLEAQNLTL